VSALSKGDLMTRATPLVWWAPPECSIVADSTCRQSLPGSLASVMPAMEILCRASSRRRTALP